jgi:hypothetical protein
MASEFVAFRQITWIGATLPAFVRLAVLLGQPKGAFCPVASLGEVVTRALGFLPAVIAVVPLALTNLLSDPYCVAICVIRFVCSSWSLLHLLIQFV